jgi:transmembrane sensor
MEYDSHTPREIQELIIRFLRHETSPDEIRWLEDWLEQDPSHRSQFDRINTTFQTLRDDQPDYETVTSAWDSLSAKIDNVSPQARVKSLSPASRFTFLKMAASVLLLVAAGIAAWKYSIVNVNAAAEAVVVEKSSNEKKLVTLPDGTRVWLNANSELRYEQDFNVSNRNVTLEGEAYFDVTKTGVDFIVHTSNLSIQVKGTRFNVKAADGGKECTTLEEGSVALKINGHEESFDMKPGDQITFNKKSEEVAHQVVNAASYSVWKEEELVFEKATLAEIVSQLEKRFQVKIMIDKTIASRENLSMVIRDETLDEVLELIRISSSLQYSINGDEVNIHEQ